MRFLQRLNGIIGGIFLLLTWPFMARLIAVYYNDIEDFFDVVIKEMIGLKLWIKKQQQDY